MPRKRLVPALVVSAGAAFLARVLSRRPGTPGAAPDLRGSQLVAHEEASLPAGVRPHLRDLFEKDKYVEGHSRRVALLAVQVGEELGLPPFRTRTLAVAGLLHDIGKLAVPDRILSKPGPLEEEEFELIRLHPTLGEELLGDLGLDGDVRRLVRDHHERLDGSGYPQGRSGDELDLDTRILSSCDVYDALISQRVYRPAWTSEQALRLLAEEAYEEVLDARCVDALERVLQREYGLVLPLPVEA